MVTKVQSDRLLYSKPDMLVRYSSPHILALRKQSIPPYMSSAFSYICYERNISDRKKARYLTLLALPMDV
jgi:hypothetical protein